MHAVCAVTRLLSGRKMPHTRRLHRRQSWLEWQGRSDVSDNGASPKAAARKSLSDMKYTYESFTNDCVE